MKTRITRLFNIEYPVIQAGMVWCSGWELASSVSNAGGLGLIGSGSMYPEVLKEHIKKCKEATDKPFGVNVPLICPHVADHMRIILKEGIRVVFTSAGNPMHWTSILKDEGVTVAHVVSSVKFARKSMDAGVDAVVAEGFEAGGHNGREETTTICLIPMVREAIDGPLIAAGGIASGRAVLAAMALGAEGVQIGSRFAASAESSAHENFKFRVLLAEEGDTALTLKNLTPVRVIKNHFYELVKRAEENGADKTELEQILGRGRAKAGIFMGDLEEGELEIGQISAMIREIRPASEILMEIWQEFLAVKNKLCPPG
ncbi:MAG: nitronate monooxygenase [Cyclobacteriaceae bacterium]|nr:nitronate monooxygenase [Cyclobacteriaceae bacterium]